MWTHDSPNDCQMPINTDEPPLGAIRGRMPFETHAREQGAWPKISPCFAKATRSIMKGSGGTKLVIWEQGTQNNCIREQGAAQNHKTEQGAKGIWEQKENSKQSR